MAGSPRPLKCGTGAVRDELAAPNTFHAIVIGCDGTGLQRLLLVRSVCPRHPAPVGRLGGCAAAMLTCSGPLPRHRVFIFRISPGVTRRNRFSVFCRTACRSYEALLSFASGKRCCDLAPYLASGRCVAAFPTTEGRQGAVPRMASALTVAAARRTFERGVVRAAERGLCQPSQSPRAHH